MISIHKALAGLDAKFYIRVIFFKPISIHKALAGLDAFVRAYYNSAQEFQSTRPSRASTCRFYCNNKELEISIHKALAGLDGKQIIRDADDKISIHKALAGLDF